MNAPLASCGKVTASQTMPAASELLFGLARVDITPPFPMPMGGYAARRDSFDGVNDPLQAEVLVLDSHGTRLVIVAADLITFENKQVPVLRQLLADLAGAAPECVLLNVTHTHGGPNVRGPREYDHTAKDDGGSGRYRQWLQQQILDCAQQAVENLEPGTLWHGCGKTCLPMNRRLERDGAIVNAPNPDGPIDDRLQVLALRDRAGQLRALGLRASCHPVATGSQHLITADYPGAFKKACQEVLGQKVMPFFLQGAGGDMRPAAVAAGERWRQMPHAELAEVGQKLLQEALNLMLQENGLEKITPGAFRGAYVEAEAPCEQLHTTREDFLRFQETCPSWQLFYPQAALALLDNGQPVPNQVKIGVQTIWLNDDFAIVAIQGEVLIGLGNFVEKSLHPKKVLLLGYSNGCIAYLPDSHEVKRGGYEQLGYIYHVWTGPFQPGLEKVIAKAVRK